MREGFIVRSTQPRRRSCARCPGGRGRGGPLRTAGPWAGRAPAAIVVAMDRLSAVDASFLRVESPTAHMHVGWLSVVERPAELPRLDAQALRARIAARLPHVPRFRQRIVSVPLAMAEPVWADDPAFDLGAHVLELPDDGELDGRELRAVADEFLSRPLDRARPLWEILVIPRMTCGRAAIVGKV